MADSLAIDADSPQLPRANRKAIGRSAVVALVLIAAMAVFWMWRFSTTATAFDTSGNVTSGQNAPVPGTAYNFAVLIAPLPQVTIQSAEVLLEDASGPAAVAVSVCRSSNIGANAGALEDDCTPLDGTDLAGMPDTARIVVTLVPLTQEPIQATGLRIRFKDGWRSGEQTLPLNLTA